MRASDNKSPVRGLLITLVIIVGIGLSVIFSVIILLVLLGFALVMLTILYARRRWLRWRHSGLDLHPGAAAPPVRGHTIEGEYTIKREPDGRGAGRKH